jgi:hypothetical protein
MELVWATDDLVIAGQPYPKFPILLWDSMESCVPANQFFRHYLLRGAIGSDRSWPSTGRALYDFFSFLQAHEMDWRDVDRGEAKSLVAAYRDYCLVTCELGPNTTRQRLIYICKFYNYALKKGWLDQGNQTLPGHDLIHLDQKTLAAGLLTFAGVLGIGEGHLFHRGSTVVFGSGGYFTKSESLFQSFPRRRRFASARVQDR